MRGELQIDPGRYGWVARSLGNLRVAFPQHRPLQVNKAITSEYKCLCYLVLSSLITLEG